MGKEKSATESGITNNEQGSHFQGAESGLNEGTFPTPQGDKGSSK